MNLKIENRIAIQLTRANANRLAQELHNHGVEFVEDCYDTETGIFDLIIKQKTFAKGKRVDKFIQIMANDWVILHKNGDIDVYDRYWKTTGSINHGCIDGLYQVFGNGE